MISEPIIIDFSRPESLDEVAEFIGTSKEILEQITNEADQSKFYKQHRIPKKKNPKEFRIVWEAEKPDLRAAHKSFQRRFEDFAIEKTDYPTDDSHGYISGKSTFTNASVHVQKKHILHADIKDFFPTITSARLQQMFQTFGMKPAPAEILAKFLTINGNLALGLPSSPLLANLICLGLDEKLANLASKYNSKFTRYADDLTFSSDAELPSKLEIKEILEAEGFVLAEEKFYTTKLGQNHFVTGLSVSDEKARIPRKLKNRIRQELYYAKKFGLVHHLGKINAAGIRSGVNRIDGTISYIYGVEPELSKKFREIWDEILSSSNIKPGYNPAKGVEPWEVEIFLGSTEILTDSGKVLIVGCITTEDEERINKETLQTIRRYSLNPLQSGYIENLNDTGLSFENVNETVRTEYTERLLYLPFRSFIAYDFLKDETGFEEKYLSLLSSIIPRRLMTADQANVTLVVEENPKAPFANTESLIKKLYSSLEENNYKRPLAPLKIVAGKKNTNPALSVTDFILNVFKNYAVLNKYLGIGAQELNPVDVNVETLKRYERLRDKIRFIESKITGEIFTQKNPFVSWNQGLPENQKQIPNKKTESPSKSKSKTPDLVKEIIAAAPLALVMKGGGIKGLAYVGAIKELEKYYKFNWFVGTSAGAIVAALLAAGQTVAELEQILGETDFNDFFDAKFYELPTNLLFYKGLHTAEAFRIWIGNLISRRLESPTEVLLKELPNRATFYASTAGKKALVFDSKSPQSEDVPVSFAVRCSMSIPYIFTAQKQNGAVVVDGGVQNNYPVEALLGDNPNAKFIGLYLGPEIYEEKRESRWLLGDLFAIFFNTDTEALRIYRERTVIIDPRPISTLNFKLSAEEKDFLLKAGRASALKFLAKEQKVAVETAAAAKTEAEEARQKVQSVRKKRKRKKLLAVIIIALIIFSAAYYFLF